MADAKVDGRTVAAKAARASIQTSDVADEVSETRATEVLMENQTATDDIERPDLAIVTDESMDSPAVKEYAKDLAFANEPVTFSISPTNDKNAENPVSCGVNGVRKFFTRGERYTVPRKFIEALIVGETSVEVETYKDAKMVDQTKIVPKIALKYPISIHNDPANERLVPGTKTRLGDAWFQHQCRNAW
jgi:hypothetical protein